MIYAFKKRKKERTQPDPMMTDVSCNPYTVLLSSFNGFFWVGGGLLGGRGVLSSRGCVL